MIFLSIALSLVAAVVLFGVHMRFRARSLGFRGSFELNATAVEPDTSETASLAESGSSIQDTIIDTIYAIGDLHGDAKCAKEWISATGLVDESFTKWLQPTANLVFVGDYIDKGPTSLQTALMVKVRMPFARIEARR
jgi:hypothetical protein